MTHGPIRSPGRAAAVLSALVLSVLSLSALAVLLGLHPAMAASVTGFPTADSAYRYWTYWVAEQGDWTFATMGPGARAPKDGDVEGWRFEISPMSGGQPPRTAPSLAFSRICSGSTAPAGMKRIAIVIDTGTPQDAPTGQQPPPPQGRCATVSADATSAMALSAVADVRVEGGLVCGLAGYPTGECAPIVEAAGLTASTDVAVNADVDAEVDVLAPSTSAPIAQESVTTTGPANSPAGVIAGTVAVLAAATTAVVVARRRRRSSP